MKNLLVIALFYFMLVLVIDCNGTDLTKRVQITNGVSVLMPPNFIKNELNGYVLFQSEIGSTDLRVIVVKDMSLPTKNAEMLKKGMEINVVNFLKPLNGKLLHRKDTIIDNLARSDFDFEIVNPENTKYGVGRFIVKGNNFISFLFETLKTDIKTNKVIRESFFKSIQIVK